MPDRRHVIAGGLASLVLPSRAFAAAPGAAARANDVLANWYRLVLELVRHTPTYSPPVASRTFAYLGIGAWLAQTPDGGASLVGQLPGFSAMPVADRTDQACCLHATLAGLAGALFVNTGPTGQRALTRMTERLGARAAEGVDPAAAADGLARGAAIAGHILDWAATDGGAVIDNLGFGPSTPPADTAADWVPTSAVRLQQAPLLPTWGTNRPFAMTALCDAPSALPYDETPGSAFHAQAVEVMEIARDLTDEQRHIARFWADDAMLSPTPPGHWISIALQIAARDGLPPDRTAEVLMRLGIALADAFIACWHTKYAVNLLRPVTYIRRHLDPGWSPLLITPPFPEYPSGHSVQSGAAAVVLTAFFGPGFAFDDATHADDGIAPRHFPDFHAAASEAAVSRLYGGIHFRAAVENGLIQGECVGAQAVALRVS